MKPKPRLGRKDIFTGNQIASQPASKQVSQQTSKEKYQTVSYYVTREMKWKIKTLAAQKEKEISELVREIFSEYFSRHNY